MSYVPLKEENPVSKKPTKTLEESSVLPEAISPKKKGIKESNQRKLTRKSWLVVVKCILCP